MTHARLLPLPLALSLTLGCTALAGIDELVDHPCEQAICAPDSASSVESGLEADSAIGDSSAVVDSAHADSGGTDVEPAETSPDVSVDAGPCAVSPTPLIAVTTAVTSYRIERTEVTRAQYGAFLAALVPITAQPASCAWNTTFKPPGWAPPTAASCDRPVVFVDWCDAHAYCAWAGRRLCGGIGGATLDAVSSDATNPGKDEWHHVCTNGGGTDYPYGDGAIVGACVDNAFDGTPGYNPSTDLSRDVGTATACRGTGAFGAVYDLVGNVREWENACSNRFGGPSADECRARGGSFAEDTSCSSGASFRRDAAMAHVGIRCCAD